MGGKMEHLVVMDVPGIKEYVFGTDRLVEIRGASALLDSLNRKHMLEFLQNKLGPSEVDCVFAGGGAGQFILTADQTALHEAITALQALFTRKSNGGLKLIVGMAEMTGSDYGEALENAFLRLTREKEESPFTPCTPVHTGFVRECQSCSGMASTFSSYGSETRLLCHVCFEKVRYGAQKRGLWKEFSRYLESRGIPSDVSDSLRPGDFEEIGERCFAKRGYTALVYADGNAMGKLVKQIQTPDQFRFFSETVDRSIREACYEALHENCPEVQRKIPADILLLGGDDLLVYLSAETALPFAIAAARKFTEKTGKRFADSGKDPFFKEMLQGRGLSISVGIAYGKSHTPFSIMLDQAEELLVSAKKKGAGEDFSPACIDYHMSVHFNQLKVSDSRKNHLTLDSASPLLLYQKPYRLEDVEALLGHARNLVAKKIPRSRLKRLGAAPSLGKVGAMLECMKVFSRTRGEEERMSIWNALNRFGCAASMPWREGSEQIDTVMVDLMELTEFVPG